MAASGGAQQHLYKVLVVGDYAVGKTSLIRRYAHGYFTPNYKLTIGVDFAIKQVQYDDATTVSLQLWDIAGHERFGYMTSVYYKYALACLIVYDLSRPPTFPAVLKWKRDVDDKVRLRGGGGIPSILIANKCDIPGSHADAPALDAFCEENGFTAWFATSAQDDLGIDRAMGRLVEELVRVGAGESEAQPSEDTISLGSQESGGGGSGKCKC